MTLKEKIGLHFEGKVVRKDLTKEIKGNAVVPGYVLEYLLGQHCASSDPEIVHLGLEKVRNIITHHFVHRDEAQQVISEIFHKGNHTVIDKVAVRFNEKKGIFEATFTNLNISKVMVDSDTVNRHKKLLTNGVWCIAKIGYHQSEEKDQSPWLLMSLKPIQISNSNLEEYKNKRKNFTTEEWSTLIMQSLGLNAGAFNFRTILIQLARLIPFCENNYNFIELGPKGTGKSHIFSELSPHGILISGGDVTQAKLFVNNSNGQIGLVGYWDVVAFDEFAGSGKSADKKLVDIMKNYMANKSFSRGTDVFEASASMVFVGNTEHSVAYMLKNSNLFDALPKAYYDTAFLDRIHAYIPGWEVSKLRNEMFTSAYGFIVDYLAEILRELRKEDFSLYFKDRIEFDRSITTRDKTAIYKSIAGFIKILYPDGVFTNEELREITGFSVEMRKRVKNQLVKMDETFEEVNFSYSEAGTGNMYSVETLEELNVLAQKEENAQSEAENLPVNKAHSTILVSKIVEIKDNQTGICFKNLFGAYLKDAKFITLVDAYIRMPHQFERLAEFCAMLTDFANESNEIKLHVVTWNDEDKQELSNQNFTDLAESLENLNIKLSWELIRGHDRSIKTDTKWTIALGRGLDIYEKLESKFDIGAILQKSRKCKACKISYNKV
jgi:ATP-dependent Lon protease